MLGQRASIAAQCAPCEVGGGAGCCCQLPPMPDTQRQRVSVRPHAMQHISGRLHHMTWHEPVHACMPIRILIAQQRIGTGKGASRNSCGCGAGTPTRSTWSRCTGSRTHSRRSRRVCARRALSGWRRCAAPAARHVPACLPAYLLDGVGSPCQILPVNSLPMQLLCSYMHACI